MVKVLNDMEFFPQAECRDISQMSYKSYMMTSILHTLQKKL
jgi:hypothetical protein